VPLVSDTGGATIVTDGWFGHSRESEAESQIDGMLRS
jgi:hypothetical protein